MSLNSDHRHSFVSAPNGERGIGHRDVQEREEPIGVGKRQIAGARNLIRCLIPVDAGVTLPKHSERRLVGSARRSVARPSALTVLKSLV